VRPERRGCRRNRPDGRIALYVSPSILAEYEEVLRRPRLKPQPRQIDAAMAAIRKVAHLVQPTQAVSASPHESGNRFLAKRMK
jgi:predicted nucleic acid-binding protein